MTSHVDMEVLVSTMENNQFFVFGEHIIYVDELIILIKSESREENQKAYIVIEQAIEENETLIIDVIKEIGPGIMLNDSSETVIHLAFKHKFIALLDRLFSDLNDYSNYSNNYELTHFHIACISSNLTTVERFLRSGVDVNIRCSPQFNNYSPLHIAVGEAKERLVELLLMYGANANARDAFGQSPLHLACYVSTALCESVASVFGSGNKSDCIMYMISNGCIELNIVKLLVEYKSDVDARDRYGNTPMYPIFKNDYYAKLKSIDPELINEYLIDCNNLHHDIVQVLRNKQKEKIQFLLKSGADTTIVNYHGETVLHKVIGEIILFRQPTNLSDMSFNDAISSELVKLLLESGFDVNARNENNETPLDIAISVLSIDIVNILIHYDADTINVKLIFADTNWIHYPNILPCLEAVDNLIAIIDVLSHKGLILSLEHNLSILQFFILRNMNCRYMDPEDENISYKFKNLLEFGTLTNVINVFGAVSVHAPPEFSHCVFEYLGALKISKFYMSAEVADCFKNILFNSMFLQSEYLSVCKGQSQALKKIMLVNGKSLHDMSVLHPYRIYAYIKVDDYKPILRSADFQHDFHCLAGPINGHIAKSKIRRYITDSIHNYLEVLTLQNLPEYCCRKIINYLSNEELLNLCIAATLENKRTGTG